MKDRMVICNDDCIQMIHHCIPGNADKSIRDWVDFFLESCGVDIFALCTAMPDVTNHETFVGERHLDGNESFLSQSQLHDKDILDEIRAADTDILKIVTDQVHLRHRRVIASMRMSDVHHANKMYDHLAPKFMREHSEWRIRQEDGSVDVALDYGFEGVRNHRLAILKELADSYDLDGIELDFMRSCRFFPSHKAATQIKVMTDFVRRVREILDDAATKSGDRLILGIRVPPSLNECFGLGMDPESWIRGGLVDYVAPSDYMWLDFGVRVEEYASICHGTSCGVYPCINPFAAEWVDHRAVNAYTPNPVNFNRRVFFTDAHFRGALRNYASRGADGIYSFNFCCETIDNPQFVERAHATMEEDEESLWKNNASYFFLPIWRANISPSGADQRRRTLRFDIRNINQRLSFLFRVAPERSPVEPVGRMRFRIYNLHEKDLLSLDLNGEAIRNDAILERRKTNIHVAADSRYPGLHFPPHISYEIDLAKCPPLRGDNELGVTLLRRNNSIQSECMMEALEIETGWEGSAQNVGYVLPS